MRHTIVTLSDIAKAGFRLDPGYYLALAELREHQEAGAPLLDHLKATVSEDDARAWLRRLPAAEVAKRVAPLLTRAQASQAATTIVDRVAAERPHEGLALVVAALDDMKTAAAQATRTAQEQEAALDSLAQVRPSRRRQP